MSELNILGTQEGDIEVFKLSTGFIVGFVREEETILIGSEVTYHGEPIPLSHSVTVQQGDIGNITSITGKGSNLQVSMAHYYIANNIPIQDIKLARRDPDGKLIKQ